MLNSHLIGFLALTKERVRLLPFGWHPGTQLLGAYLNSYKIIIIFDAAAGKNSACIDNEARYNQARQYGFSEKMSFLPGTI
ncbi:MAG: hypothetical protein KZQ71_15820 [Candidatus Thiodiazotropha sp. (ex Lucinoma aequizonata)]|nr:hypothetical protein [Candidatus Thiodiazotropha sp. (ex Lucinoma aequizonata)]MCU7909888.1 hypothetical protein [Candidatus Thiodiazotropha sp. (ex Lucinoma aequizonata)]